MTNPSASEHADCPGPRGALQSEICNLQSAIFQPDSPWGLPDGAGCIVGARGWPRTRHPSAGRPTAVRSGFLLLLTLLIFGFGVVSVCWRTAPRSDPAEFDLLADASSSNLDVTSAEEPSRFSAREPPAKLDRTERDATPLTEPTPNAPALEVKPEPPIAPVVTVPAAAEENPVPAPAHEPARLPEVVTASHEAPAVETSPAIPIQQGDSIMIHHWKLLGLHAVLAAV